MHHPFHPTGAASLKLSAALVFLVLPLSSQAFLPSLSKSINNNFYNGQTVPLQMSASNQNVVVISPPGGVGEVAAVQAAKLGSSVKWFVVSPPSQTASAAVTISSEALESIDGNGSLELAGADAETLLLPSDDPSSALKAVSTWCSNASGIICTLDGVDEAVIRASRRPGVSAKQTEASELMKINNIVSDAIKVAAKEACSSPSTMKVAVVPAFMDNSNSKEDNDEEEDNETNLLSSLFGEKKINVPKSLSKAMRTSGSSNNFATLRYGELFGIPESSPDASPLVGGPRRYPVLRDEYTMRSVRIDPTISLSGNAMDSTTRSSRFSIGEAAVRMATKELNVEGGLDICLTSLRGVDCLTNEDWVDEFSRVQDMISSGKGAQLFAASFGSVPSVERLGDWIATKWAPAVMKTYDVAGIRVGDRPVYASVTGEGKVEIVWQNIINFKSVTVGKMVIEITDTGISAVRGPGNASDGFGSISPTPLQAEDILVRRLSDAATQAIEKGLATKPAPKARPKKKEVVEVAVVSTVVSAGAVEAGPGKSEVPVQAVSETGPRGSGARRSSERVRGKRRKQSPSKD